MQGAITAALVCIGGCAGGMVQGTASCLAWRCPEASAPLGAPSLQPCTCVRAFPLFCHAGGALRADSITLFPSIPSHLQGRQRSLAAAARPAQVAAATACVQQWRALSCRIPQSTCALRPSPAPLTMTRTNDRLVCAAFDLRACLPCPAVLSHCKCMPFEQSSPHQSGTSHCTEASRWSAAP